MRTENKQKKILKLNYPPHGENAVLSWIEKHHTILFWIIFILGISVRVIDIMRCSQWY